MNRLWSLLAPIRYDRAQFMMNSSARELFGITAKRAVATSRVIRDALDVGVIVIEDEAAAKRERRDLPWWARGAKAPKRRGEGI